eukprot:5363332-Pyramimonas_sp.AAC.1
MTMRRGGQAGPNCLAAAEDAARNCTNTGWTERPTWVEVAAGMRPPERPPTENVLGEWQNGWQFQ